MAYSAGMPQVAVIEDNATEFELLEYACQSLSFKVVLRHYLDGQALLDDLEEGQFLPVTFFLIDLNNPVLQGDKLVQALRKIPYCRLRPIIIFSSSTDPEDVKRCLQAGANAYVVKPISYEEFTQAVHHIFIFWGGINQEV